MSKSKLKRGEIMVKIKIKTPSKAKMKREMKKAIRKSLVCPKCGHKLPTTYASQTKCSRCGVVINLSI